MPAIQSFVGPSYKLNSINSSGDRSINVYPEVIEKGPRAGTQRLVGIPGLTLYVILPVGPIRCLWAGDNRLFCVANDTLWEVFQAINALATQAMVGSTAIALNNSAGISVGNTVTGQGIAQGTKVTSISGLDVILSTGTIAPLNNTPINFAPPPVNNGNVGPATNPAIIQSNGSQLCIASGGQLYLAPGNIPAYPIIDIEGFPVTCATVAFQDQYFIGGYVNSKTIIVSNLSPDGGTWDPGNEAEKEGYSDNVVRVWVDEPGGEYLWLFGNDTTEVWMDTGGLFPFTRVQSMVFPIGCDSAWSVAGVEGQRFWLWKGVVWSATGFQPVRISDYGVEEAIQSYSYYDQTNAEAFCYFDGGHLFYVLIFPESGACWAYDATTQAWHERYYVYNGQFTRYRPRVYAKQWGIHFVGDYSSGAIFAMSSSTYVDAPPSTNLTGPSVPLLRERICPYITDNMKNTRYNRLTLDMETGIGLDVAQGQPGYDPQVYMRYSDNRGYTWSNYLQAPNDTSINKVTNQQGRYNTRIIFTQLGSSRIGKVFDVSMTDPVPFSVNGAYIDLDQSTWPRP